MRKGELCGRKGKKGGVIDGEMERVGEGEKEKERRGEGW